MDQGVRYRVRSAQQCLTSQQGTSAQATSTSAAPPPLYGWLLQDIDHRSVNQEIRLAFCCHLLAGRQPEFRRMPYAADAEVHTEGAAE